MYTEFKYEGRVSDKYVKMIEELYEDYDSTPLYKIDKFFVEFAKKYPIFKRFSKLSRNLFILWSSEESHFDSKTKVWTISCELKNYSHEIEVFLEDILNVVNEEVKYCTYQYEEMETYVDIEFPFNRKTFIKNYKELIDKKECK